MLVHSSAFSGVVFLTFPQILILLNSTRIVPSGWNRRRSPWFQRAGPFPYRDDVLFMPRISYVPRISCAGYPSFVPVTAGIMLILILILILTLFSILILILILRVPFTKTDRRKHCGSSTTHSHQTSGYIKSQRGASGESLVEILNPPMATINTSNCQ